MRKLASIQHILKLEPIPGADAIEKATVLGWHLVVKKGEFKENDLCIYVEVDSILPEREVFEFLRPRHFRIKTIKLRGQVSQGIAFPITLLTYDSSVNPAEYPLNVGDDVTELLKVKKYEPNIPAQLAGKIKGSFPGWLHKTDETRIQSVPEVLPRHQDKKFVVTEKIDGTSMTVYLNGMEHGGEFGVCSRNLDLKEEGETAYWKYVRKHQLEEKMRAISAKGDQKLLNFSLQGELAGPGIQGNKYHLDDVQFFIFNVFDIDRFGYVDLNVIEKAPGVFVYEFLEAWELQHVPIVTSGYALPGSVDEIVEYSKAKSLLHKDTWREGIVLRSQPEAFDEELHRLSFKVINPNFLLKYDE